MTSSRSSVRTGLWLDEPGMASPHRQGRAAIDDPVEIMAPNRRDPRVECFRHAFGGQNGNRVRPHVRVQAIAQNIAPPILAEVGMRDLAHGMDAGIRASGAAYHDSFAAKGVKRGLDYFLHGKAIALPLPADEGRAVIFQGKFKARHRFSGRAAFPCLVARRAKTPRSASAPCPNVAPQEGGSPLRRRRSSSHRRERGRASPLRVRSACEKLSRAPIPCRDRPRKKRRETAPDRESDCVRPMPVFSNRSALPPCRFYARR